MKSLLKKLFLKMYPEVQEELNKKTNLIVDLCWLLNPLAESDYEAIDQQGMDTYILLKTFLQHDCKHSSLEDNYTTLNNMRKSILQVNIKPQLKAKKRSLKW